MAVVRDKGVCFTLHRRTDRAQLEATPEEGMGGIGDLNLGHVVRRWIIEGGIKL
jgi:hypothetical protein